MSALKHKLLPRAAALTLGRPCTIPRPFSAVVARSANLDVPSSSGLGMSRPLHSTARKLNADPTRSNKQLLPEFSLKDKIVVVSGGGRGVGLVQAEAVLEAGATGTAFSSTNLLPFLGGRHGSNIAPPQYMPSTFCQNRRP